MREAIRETNHAVHLEEGELTIAVHIQAYKDAPPWALARYAFNLIAGMLYAFTPRRHIS